MSDDDPIRYTRGVGSPVYAEDDPDEVIGHVLLLDLDGVDDEMDVHRLAAEMGDSDGLTAVFESSPRSFHLWALRPRPFDEALLDALSVRLADAEHIQQSEHRRSMVLRAAPKVREDGSTYKESPSLRAVYDDGESDVARGHYQIVARQWSGEIDEQRLVGAETVESHSYMTVSDSAKEEIRA